MLAYNKEIYSILFIFSVALYYYIQNKTTIINEGFQSLTTITYSHRPPTNILFTQLTVGTTGSIFTVQII